MTHTLLSPIYRNFVEDLVFAALLGLQWRQKSLVRETLQLARPPSFPWKNAVRYAAFLLLRSAMGFRLGTGNSHAFGTGRLCTVAPGCRTVAGRCFCSLLSSSLTFGININPYHFRIRAQWILGRRGQGPRDKEEKTLDLNKPVVVNILKTFS